MKLFFACFTFIALAANCNSKKTALTKTNENTPQQRAVSISYCAHTRGFFQELILTQNNLVEFKDYKKSKAISSTLDAKDWDESVKLLSQIDLEKLPNLESPTNYRQSDRAAFARLTVIQKGDTIQSSSFDHKHPPEEIKPLVEYILSLQEN